MMDGVVVVVGNVVVALVFVRVAVAVAVVVVVVLAAAEVDFDVKCQPRLDPVVAVVSEKQGLKHAGVQNGVEQGQRK